MAFVLFVLILVADQLTKYAISANFLPGESLPVVPHIFHITYVLNPGAAFGMLEGSRWLFVLIAVAVIGCVWFMRREIAKSGVMACWGTALFAGGALGNLIDRTTRGVVIDFFDFRIWPIFNVADIAICVGVGLIIWSILKTELLSSND